MPVEHSVIIRPIAMPEIEAIVSAQIGFGEGVSQFHFTPTSASWLNQVEIWFGLLKCKTLRGTSFTSKDQLRSAIEAFVSRTNHPPQVVPLAQARGAWNPAAQYDYQFKQLDTSQLDRLPADHPARPRNVPPEHCRALGSRPSRPPR